MSTRSRIGYVRSGDGKIVSIYCHSDGYPSHNGKMLLENYNTLGDVMDLVSHGDMSFLDKSVACPDGHSFDNRVDGYSIFYGRDRGETDVKPETSKNEKEFLTLTIASWGDYAYLFNNGEWFYATCGGRKSFLFKRLTKAACKD